MIKNTIVLGLVIIFLGLTAASAQQQKKTKGAGNKSNAASNPTDSPPKKPLINNAPKKRVVVVLNFDDASLIPSFKKKEMGRQMAILLSNEIASRGDFDVVERDSIEKVIAAQDKSYDSRFDPKLAAAIGKNWSATSIVLGTITEYTVTTDRKSLMGVGQITTTAKVGLAVRLVNVNTGEVQDSANVSGVENKKDILGGPYGTSTTDVNEELKTSLLTSAASKATKEAVNKLEKLIDKNSRLAVSTDAAASENNQSVQTSKNNSQENKDGVLDKINIFKRGKNKQKDAEKLSSTTSNQTIASSSVNTAPATALGKIIAVSANKVYLKGSFSSAKVGSQLAVYRIVKEITDTDNPKVIVFIETEDVAKIEILEIQPTGISAKTVSGSGIKVGDLVKLP